MLPKDVQIYSAHTRHLKPKQGTRQAVDDAQETAATQHARARKESVGVEESRRSREVAGIVVESRRNRSSRFKLIQFIFDTGFRFIFPEMGLHCKLQQFNLYAPASAPTLLALVTLPA